MEGLLQVPWAATVRAAQAGHDVEQTNKFFRCALMGRRVGSIHEAVPVDLAGPFQAGICHGHGVDDKAGMD